MTAGLPGSPSSGRLAGKRAVVTGAAGGIGHALAVGVARAGAAVACLDVDEAGNDATAEAIRSEGGEAVAFAADLSDWDAVTATSQEVHEALGGVDILVANAGGSRGETVPFLDLDPQIWGAMIDRNLTSAFYCGLVYGRLMARAGNGGAIVFTSSQLSEAVRPGMSHYSASKGGVRQLVKGMAVDLAPHGIRVNAMAPGPTMTPANRELFERPDVRDANERMIPLRRIAEPEEMVGAVVYLASDEASYTTGTTLFVDGGYTIV